MKLKSGKVCICIFTQEMASSFLLAMTVTSSLIFYSAFMKQAVLVLLITALSQVSFCQKHTFHLSKTDFLLDNKPFQIIGGEMHPARIPKEYWRHRIQMAKEMGCNTNAA